MLEFIVFGGVVVAASGFAYQLRRKARAFESHANDWECTLQQFMKVHNLHEFDIKLANNTEVPCEKKDTLNFVGRDLDKGYDFIVCELSKGYTFPTHLHDRASEFFYVLTGRIQVQHEEKIEIIGPGGHAYVKNKINHSFIALDDTTCIVVAVPSMIDE